MFCPQQSQLKYDYNLYHYGVENNNILPASIGELCNDDIDDTEIAQPIFEHEWTVSNVSIIPFHLYYILYNARFYLNIIRSYIVT